MKLLRNIFITTALTFAAVPVVLAGDSEHARAHDNGHAHEHKAAEKPETETVKSAAPATHTDDHAHGDGAHEHPAVEPHHDGVAMIVDGFHHELIIEKEGRVLLYIEGLPQGEAVKLVSVSLQILEGKEKRQLEMRLTEGDQHLFEVAVKPKLAAGAKVVASIVLGDENTRLVRFEVPAK